MSTRPARVAALAVAVALAACEPPPPDEPSPPDEPPESRPEAQEVRHLGTDESCQRTPEGPLTRPFQTITVEDGGIVVEPDSVMQPPAAGIFGWTSPDHSWRITYPEGESPLDTAEASLTGAPGELVWAGVREDAPCRFYKFDVQVWGGDLEDTLEVDPGGGVQPFQYGG